MPPMMMLPTIPRRLIPLLAVVAAAAGLAGCADTHWVNPALPRERAGADLAACRRAADRALGPGAYVAPGDERTTDPMRMVDRSHTLNRYDRAVADCMEDKGYTRAK